MAGEARPSAPICLFTQPKTQTEKDRRWGMWVVAVLYVMNGVLWLLSGIFSSDISPVRSKLNH
jgi:hypothetical protein